MQSHLLVPVDSKERMLCLTRVVLVSERDGDREIIKSTHINVPCSVAFAVW